MAEPNKDSRESLIAFSGGHLLYAGGDDAAEAETDAIPSDVEVLLSGEYATRKLKVTRDRLEEMVRNHKASNVDPAIDREHESAGLSLFSSAPSAAHGWVKSLRVEPSKRDARRHALVASVEWTDLGEQAIRAKHYRYLSAGFNPQARDPMSGKSIGWVLDHVSLVKNPYVQGMVPLSLSANAQEGEPSMELLANVNKTLGLSADADEAAACKALEKLADLHHELVTLTGEEKKAAILGTVRAWKEAVGRADELSTELVKLKADGRKRDVDSLVREALKAGQITPAQKDWALSCASSDEGLQMLSKFLEHAPRRVAEEHKAPPTKAEIVALSAAEKRIARLCGNDPEAVRKFAAEHPVLPTVGTDDDDDEQPAQAAASSEVR